MLCFDSKKLLSDELHTKYLDFTILHVYNYEHGKIELCLEVTLFAEK